LPTDLDTVLTAQLIVAWAGEEGEEPRLGWWRSDLVGDYGGKDLFRRLLPATWMWAVVQAVSHAWVRRWGYPSARSTRAHNRCSDSNEHARLCWCLGQPLHCSDKQAGHFD
jgi:hypothetical protein